jgi:hypothetical protein
MLRQSKIFEKYYDHNLIIDLHKETSLSVFSSKNVMKRHRKYLIVF